MVRSTHPTPSQRHKPPPADRERRERVGRAIRDLLRTISDPPLDSPVEVTLGDVARLARYSESYLIARCAGHEPIEAMRRAVWGTAAGDTGWGADAILARLRAP